MLRQSSPGEWLPTPLVEWSLLELQLWQWIGLALLGVLAYFVSWLVVRSVFSVSRRLARQTENEIDDRLLAAVPAPARVLLALAIVVVGVVALRLSGPAHRVLLVGLKALAILAVIWLALRIVDVFLVALQERLQRADQRAASAVIPLARRTLKAFLLALAVIGVLQNLGIQVTGLLAGLGLSGLALALAAQKSVANLFGGVTLVTDQPVREGDVCSFGGKTGTVERIGLRSTRVRTAERTLITVPNSEFAEMQLENFASRDRVKLATVLGLRCETTPDQLRVVLAELRKLLLAHPKVSKQPARVRFAGFGAHSLDVDLFAYILTRDYDEFLAVQEDLYLRFMDVLEAAGTGLAFPSQTLYLGRDGGPDPQRAEAASRQVRQWRESGTLPFPEFPAELVERVTDRLDYPPHGSAAGS